MLYGLLDKTWYTILVVASSTVLFQNGPTTTLMTSYIIIRLLVYHIYNSLFSQSSPLSSKPEPDQPWSQEERWIMGRVYVLRVTISILMMACFFPLNSGRCSHSLRCAVTADSMHLIISSLSKMFSFLRVASIWIICCLIIQMINFQFCGWWNLRHILMCFVLVAFINPKSSNFEFPLCINRCWALLISASARLFLILVGIYPLPILPMTGFG